MTNFTVVGTSYQQVGIEVREKLFVNKANYNQIHQGLCREFKIKELVLISTCNRLEIYYFAPSDFQYHPKEVFHKFLTLKGFSSIDTVNHIFYEDKDALRHLFRVSSSLESLVLGEPQILGQVKEAFDLANRCSPCTYLGMLFFEKAFSTAKEIRHKTKIAENAISISYLAVELSKQIFENLQNKKALVVGSGEMGELALIHLKNAGLSNVLIANRTFKSAVDLAEKFQGSVVQFNDLLSHIADVDIIISSTGATNFIFDYQSSVKLLKKRRSPTLFIDIAVPRDVDPTLNKLPDVYVYDIDDLQNVIDSNLKQREKEAQKAHYIIERNLEKLIQSLEVRKKYPLLKSFREKYTSTSYQDAEKFLSKYSFNKEEKDAILMLVSKITKKFLHYPTIFLRNNQSQVLDLLFIDIFGQEISKELEKTQPETDEKDTDNIIYLNKKNL